MSWREHDLPELVAALATRPGHERVRTMVAEILHHGFGLPYLAADHEVRLPLVGGRIDMLFGATVFEFKSDLGRELADAHARLPDYLGERERQTGRHFLGIATDGATFIAFERHDGALAEIGRHVPRVDRAEALLAWLEPAVSARDDLAPEPLTMQRELGRDSLTWGRARGGLERLWAALGAHPDVMLKRQLWDGLLREAYGTAVGDDRLFLQHTYLTIVAKTIAARVLDLPAANAADILSGRALADAGILGAVESDFFDWVLGAPEGERLVLGIAQQAARFRLRDARADVLKALYESLIDPDQRHDLGEYYTPDWLAAKLVRAAVAEPGRQRVLDPACGSGTFLFHAIRRLLAAAAAAGLPRRQAVAACAAQVRGLDIHPVAVIIARATWLLALGDAIEDRPPALHIPVFLGDAMQWNLRVIGDSRDVIVPVPDEAPLHIPAGFAEDQAKFEPGLRVLEEGLGRQGERRGGGAGACAASRAHRIADAGGDVRHLRAAAGAGRRREKRHLEIRAEQPRAPDLAVAPRASRRRAIGQSALGRLPTFKCGDEGAAARGVPGDGFVGRRRAGHPAGFVCVVLGARGRSGI